MEFLGVGPTELLFIVAIALILLGPKDLAKTGRTVGKWLNSLIQSDTWKVMQKTTKELRKLPTHLMREDNLEKFLTEGNEKPHTDAQADTWSGQTGGRQNRVPLRADPSTSLRTSVGAEPKNENRIHPPVTVTGPPAETLNPAQKKPAVKARKKSPPAKKTEKRTAAKPSTRAPRKKPNA
jgi:Sec-independent protein translocase protein TatA